VSQFPYAIEVRNRMLERWHALEDEYSEDMHWFKDFLKQHPTNIRITNGKIKKLKGDLKNIYQYDVSYKDRVRYTVDKENRMVKVVFAKGHP
jgi:mRNA-degrading endonuclease RelE of RelBE toxin-antitoxin system